MLKLAKLYENELNLKFMNCINQPHFKYYMGSWSNFGIELDNDNWNNLQFVSVDKNNTVIGFIECRIDRIANYVWGLSAINFTTKECDFTFGCDLKNFFDLIFKTYKYNKIKWTVFTGNPAEAMYDKFVKKYNGRIVGIYKEDFYTYDKELCDKKLYELMRKDYLKAGK